MKADIEILEKRKAKSNYKIKQELVKIKGFNYKINNLKKLLK